MATNTYVALDKVTANGSVSTITFTGISQAYTDLRLVISGYSTGGVASLTMQLNSDTGNSYSDLRLVGNGSSASSAKDSGSVDRFYLWNIDGTQCTMTADFMNYSNTTTYKTVLARLSAASYQVWASVGTWRNTAAVTSITLAGATFAAGTTFSLYGIANSDIGAYATGGIITYDANYYYHTFAASGTFTPKQSLSCDVLVIAGGGGASRNFSGGAGAGGCLAFGSQSLSATGYTVTVGAGGAGVASDSSYPSQGVNSQFGALTAAVGGGYGGTRFGSSNTGGNGGSGGGGPYGGAGGTATSGQGNNGGQWVAVANGNFSAGGGGAGGIGGNPTATDIGGNGGLGTASVTNWGSLTAMFSATGLGVSGTIAGGGSGVGPNGNGTVSGGGGQGINSGTTPNNGVANTGGGAGGMMGNAGTGASGGSGVVIVRYAK